MNAESRHKKIFFKELEIEVEKFHKRHEVKTTFFSRLKNHADIVGLEWNEELLEAIDIVPKAVIALRGILKS